MRRVLVFAAVTLSVATVTLPAQTSLNASLDAPSATALTTTRAVLVREIAPPAATSTHPFRMIFTVRETSGGRVLVNDPIRHQLILLDGTLQNPLVVIDSSNPGGQSYGDWPAPTVKWLGDSSLHLDVPSKSLLVLDGSGKIARTMAPPKQSDFGRIFADQSGLDLNGNLLHRGFSEMVVDTSTGPNGSFTRSSHPVDSLGVVRANFSTRSVDTIAKLRQDGITTGATTTTRDGRKFLYVLFNPITTIDDWAVLSDGTLAIVRGYDYHVDFTMPDGTKRTTGKLPFDWKPLDKQRLLDSVRAKIEGIRRDAAELGGEVAGNDAVVLYLRNASVANPRNTPSNATANMPKVVEPTVTYSLPPLKDLPDYYPPIRVGATKTDEEGNLWLLPTTSAQSNAGELVYDVVNPHNSNFYRVRMPVGRSIAGFGKGGVIYLMSRHGNEWKLERTRVASTVSAKD